MTTQKTRKIKKNTRHRQEHIKNKQTHVTDITHQLLQLQAQVKFFHWKTKQYKAHMVTDKFHEKLSNHIDKFIEVCIGQDKPLHSIRSYYDNMKELQTVQSTIQKTNNVIKLLKSPPTTKLPQDLQAIIDELIIDMQRFNYLLMMH